MLAKYRSRVKILADMLVVARERVKKTHLMYRGNLSFKLVNAYLSIAMKADLICFSSEDECYSLTRKGELFLERFGRYNKRVKSFEKQLAQVKGDLVALEEMCLVRDLPRNNKVRDDGPSESRTGIIRNDDVVKRIGEAAEK